MHWESCSAVERNPRKISGAWAFTGTRVPVYALAIAQAGATVALTVTLLRLLA